MHRSLAALFVLGCTLAPLACGDDDGEGDCVSLCEDAQARDCTAITGDCGAFCDALFSIEDRSGCAGERSAYEECLNDDGVCQSSCEARESDLTSCVGGYCVGHADDGDCQVLVSSF